MSLLVITAIHNEFNKFLMRDIKREEREERGGRERNL